MATTSINTNVSSKSSKVKYIISEDANDNLTILIDSLKKLGLQKQPLGMTQREYHSKVVAPLNKLVKGKKNVPVRNNEKKELYAFNMPRPVNKKFMKVYHNLQDNNIDMLDILNKEEQTTTILNTSKMLRLYVNHHGLRKSSNKIVLDKLLNDVLSDCKQEIEQLYINNGGRFVTSAQIQTLNKYLLK